MCAGSEGKELRLKTNHQETSGGMPPIGIQRRMERLRVLLEHVGKRFTLLAKRLGGLVTERIKQTKNQNKNKQKPHRTPCNY